MARADSTIKVSIIGDVKNLIGAIDTADQRTGGLVRSGAKVVGAGIAIKKGFGELDSALDNADRFQDALSRIEGTTTPEFAQKIHDIAFDMSDIGLSAPEVAEMAASWADFATAAKVSEPAIEKITPKLIDIAAAISQQTGKPLDEIIADIGKAAAGNQKSVSDYGIVVDKSLNPDARILDILDQLVGKYQDAKTATDDFHGSQDTLNAKWDNFTTKIGEALDGPLKDLLDFINDEIDAIPHAIKGFEGLGKSVEDFGRVALTPLADVAQALRNIIDLFSHGQDAFQVSTGRAPRSEKNTVQDTNNFNDRNGNTTTNRIGGP